MEVEQTNFVTLGFHMLSMLSRLVFANPLNFLLETST